MRIRLLIALPVLLLSMVATLPSAAAESTCKDVSLIDAQILIYLLPVADQLRAQGMDIGWERQPALEAERPDHYSFWVYNSRRVSAGSVTIGYYNVDRCTGVVREAETGKIVSNRLMNHIRQIIIANRQSSPAFTDKIPNVGPSTK